MEDLIKKIAIDKYPEFWADEPNNHTMCAKQFDVNKEERQAFIDGCTYFANILKENLSISIDTSTEIDYGNSSTIITVDLIFLGEKISSSNAQL